MKVIFTPTRLRIAAALLFLCVPLAVLETLLVTRASWWRLPYRSIGIWAGSVLLICLPLSVWLMHGKRWALRVTQGFLGLWILINFALMVSLRNPSIGFFTVFLLACFSALAVWLEQELGRSFFDPQLKWYQGLPKFLPGLTCRVTWGDQVVNCRVSRLDREGVFLFRENASESLGVGVLRPDLKSELTFSFRERVLKCEALPVRAFSDGRGAGFQFNVLVPDLRKQLGDFIEILKGEGYVV